MSPLLPVLLAVPIAVIIGTIWYRQHDGMNPTIRPVLASSRCGALSVRQSVGQGTANEPIALMQGDCLPAPVPRRPDWWLIISLVSARDVWFLTVPTPDWNFCAQSINREAIKASAGTLAVSCVDLNAATVVR